MALFLFFIVPKDTYFCIFFSRLDVKKTCFQGPGGGGQQAGRGLEATSAAGRDTEKELSGEIQPDSDAQVSS
jgi:hypothetical protein